jgi:hypothetical protein
MIGKMRCLSGRTAEVADISYKHWLLVKKNTIYD